MIDYSEWAIRQVIFSWHGTTLKSTWPNVVAISLIGLILCLLCEFAFELPSYDTVYSASGVIDVVATAANKAKAESQTGYLADLDLSAQKYPLVFVAILLVFRTGFAYARFMEGRGHVGKMVLTVRDLARKLSTFVLPAVDQDPAIDRVRSNIVRLLKAFVISNRLSCRKQEGSGFAELEAVLTTTEAGILRGVKKNFPMVILQWIGKELAHFKDSQMFARALDSMEEDIGELMGAWMGMQKLATTPFPFPYAQMCTLFLYLWCYSFPFVASLSLKGYGCVIAAVLAYALFGINAVSLELEDPFGEETNDLDLNFFETACMKACAALLPPPLSPLDIEPLPAPVAKQQSHPSPILAQHQFQAGVSATTPAGNYDVSSLLANPNFIVQLHNQLKTCTKYAELSPEAMAVFAEAFNQFAGRGVIDQGNTLTKLVTYLAFALKMNNGVAVLMEQADLVGNNLQWGMEIFVDWFLKTCKTTNIVP